MTQVFINASDIAEEYIYIDGERAHHLGDVLRVKTGERVYAVCSDNNLRYECSVSECRSDKTLKLLIEDVQSASSELPVRITLFQGMPKSDKLEYVIQKAVELGVYRIVPVMTRRSVVKLSDDKAEKKCARWNLIAKSAAVQSMRDYVPQVSLPMSFGEALSEAEKCDTILMPYELAEGMDETREQLEQIRSGDPSDIAVFIGPEGGFDTEEVDRARSSGGRIITLGKRILRTETAPVTILSWLIYLFEK